MANSGQGRRSQAGRPDFSDMRTQGTSSASGYARDRASGRTASPEVTEVLVPPSDEEIRRGHARDQRTAYLGTSPASHRPPESASPFHAYHPALDIQSVMMQERPSPARRTLFTTTLRIPRALAPLTLTKTGMTVKRMSRWRMVLRRLLLQRSVASATSNPLFPRNLGPVGIRQGAM